MPAAGVEPAPCCQDWILSPARLPIPSHRRMDTCASAPSVEAVGHRTLLYYTTFRRKNQHFFEKIRIENEKSGVWRDIVHPMCGAWRDIARPVRAVCAGCRALCARRASMMGAVSGGQRGGRVSVRRRSGQSNARLPQVKGKRAFTVICIRQITTSGSWSAPKMHWAASGRTWGLRSCSY